ncbi:MAG: DUF6152 family protein [Acidobacteria bacterium]|nr:DUF6152 family protein [Acidobacteriota bacterium]
MKSKLGAVFSVAVGLVMVTGSLWAHHSDAVYDQTRLVNIKGTITKHMFVNPHQVIGMKVRDDDGRVTKWTLIGAAVSRSRAAGWSRDSLKPGDAVDVWGFQYRDGRPNMTWMRMMKDDGTMLPIAGAKNDKLSRFLGTYGKNQLAQEDYDSLKKSILWIGDPETRQR